jgi:hypothetical protein
MMERLLRRLVTVVLGLVVAIAASVIFLPLAALVDPTTREIGAALSGVALLTVFAALADANAAPAADSLGLAFQTAILAICAVPPIITALIGETAKVRSWLWYAIATGGIAAALPFVMRLGLATQSSPSPARQTAETRFALVFFLTGVLAGFLYWSVAGRRAGAGAPADHQDGRQTHKGDLP